MTSPPPARTTRATRRAVAGVVTGLLALTGTAAQLVPAAAAPAKPKPPAPSLDLGSKVLVLDPSMATADIKAAVDRISNAQTDDEMGTGRWSILFKPGTYGTATEPLQLKVGYNTEVAGLGASPDDVHVVGKIEVYNRCLDDGGTSNCIALNNFWRTLSNLTIDVNGTGQDGCRQSANFWAVSQAVSMRRVAVKGGNLSLMDYCTAGPQFASGGFIADTSADAVINGSQQQWLTRNSTVGSWSNGVWNQVFAGVEGAPDDSAFPNPPYTTLEKTPVSREKPYLFMDGTRWAVRVPSAQTDTRGRSWANGITPGKTLPLSAFHVAKPGESVKDINKALAKGQHLLLTPGIYDVDRSIEVKRPGTVVLGMGHATLTAQKGATPLEVADGAGTVIAGVTIDAGSKLSRNLLHVDDHDKGKGGDRSGRGSSAKDPLTLSDVYFRVGGPHIGKVKVALQIDADHVLVDHTWVWRADHGNEDFTGGFLGDDERWAVNTGTNGLIVNGDDVTATGLFVEHFQQHNTIWNGERGRTVLYQNELPYDPPTQADWTQPDGTLGYAGYVVSPKVRTHELWGGGSYVYNRNNPSIVTEHGFQVPTTPGVRLHHLLTVNLGAGTTRHVVNDQGSQVDNSNTGTPAYVSEYP
ncbi:glycosyl hydrolase family 28-related protein [Arthrobacter sp. NEB 688]|uniref:glycosyl hydrolase family 28-related protein n=1 Tax=Arthrobacter sp. NEB 688 TaxID=904039 RepID=UPI0015632C72|nr:glycosyl hydrolase family 28-related protein [Arthrobacter sp. NEB 688]QKE84410.1 adenylyl cyclase [Arthrobacter sp. NEB 688]